MNRSARRAERARSRRADRIAAFKQSAGMGGYETSLRPVDAIRPQDRAAIANWCLSEPTARSSCFCCRAGFTATVRPGGFLCAIAIRAPHAGTAVSACCAACWVDKTAEQIEQAALELMHRQLGTRGFAGDDT